MTAVIGRGCMHPQSAVFDWACKAAYLPSLTALNANHSLPHQPSFPHLTPFLFFQVNQPRKPNSYLQPRIQLMAEVLAVVGAAAGFAQLASQIISSIKTITSFVHQVKDAPKQVSSLLEEIDSTSQFLRSLAGNSNGDEVTLTSLRLAKGVLDELQEIKSIQETES